MGAGISGNNQQARFQHCTLPEIEHFMHLMRVYRTDCTAKFHEYSGAFIGMGAVKLSSLSRAFLSCSSVKLFHEYKERLDVFRLAVYFYAKM